MQGAMVGALDLVFRYVRQHQVDHVLVGPDRSFITEEKVARQPCGPCRWW
jgi:hypothetical protein